MIEEKCKLCNEWVPKKKIAVHYWNSHKSKYRDFKVDCETREVADIEKKEIQDAQIEHGKDDTPVFDEERRIRKEERKQEQIWKERAKPKRTETGKVNFKDVSEIVKFGEEKIHQTSCWVEDCDISNDGETINEWC